MWFDEKTLVHGNEVVKLPTPKKVSAINPYIVD